MDTTAPLAGFVSTRLDTQPGLSGLGTLLQISRLNHFLGQDFLAVFRLRFQYREDLSHVMTFSPKRKASVAATLGLPSHFISAWSVEAWQPFTGADPWEYLPWKFRACASCLRTGYHSNLFQMPWLQRCPWHREQLIERCRKCRCPLLDGFRTRRNLLECSCGHDPVSEMDILRGERRSMVRERKEFVDLYRGWVAECRNRADLLIVPKESDDHGLDALRSLISAPEPRWVAWHHAFARSMKDVHVVRHTRRVTPRSSSEAEYADMVRCAESLWPSPPGMIDLPRTFRMPLVHVTRQIARHAPDSSLTTRERRVMALAPSPRAVVTPLSRHELIFFPVQPAGARLLLDIRVLHRTAGCTVSHLAWQLLNNDPTHQRSVSGSQRLLLEALQQTLCRAYADGLKHVLGRHVPAIFDHARIRSGPRLPWTLVRRRDGDAEEIKVAWTVRRPWNDCHE